MSYFVIKKFVSPKYNFCNADADADVDVNVNADAEMPMPRFPNCLFSALMKLYCLVSY